MELRVLRYFLAVAREESISKAATYLHITQPTLSRQIMDLEVEIGKPLLIRGKKNKKIQLTKDGMILRQKAEEIVSLADKALIALQATDDNISGDIHIGGGESDSFHLIANVAKKMNSLYPNVKYNLYSGNAEDVTEKLDKGLLDFGIVIGAYNIEKYDSIPLKISDRWGLLTRKDGIFNNQDYIEAKDLIDIPLIVSYQALANNELSGWFGQSLEQLSIIGTYNLVFNASIMVQDGLGHAITLDKIINNNELKFIPFYPHLESQLYVIWKKYQIMPKAVELFITKLKEENS